MDLADSFKKGGFKQSCPHPTDYKAVRSNLKITDKQKPCFQIRGEQKGLLRKREIKVVAVIFMLAEVKPRACFCLLLSQETKVSARRTGEHTNESLVE